MAIPVPNKANLQLARAGFLGAAVFFFLFLYSVFFHGGFSILGVADERLTVVINILKTTYPVQIALYVLWLLFLHLAVGFTLGLWSGLLFTRARARLCGVLLLHGLFYIHQIVMTPQLYAELWLARGGWRKAFQVFLTDQIPPPFITVLLAALLCFAMFKAVNVYKNKSAVAAVVLAACAAALIYRPMPNIASAAPSEQKSERPNFLLIGIDSLRPDKLSGSGYQRPTTPNIDRLLSRGVFFSNVYSSLPRTFPAVVSFFTGETPPVHGVRTMFPTFESRAFLPKAIPAILADSGYTTAVISDFAGDIFPRTELGFQDVRAPDFTILTLAQLRLTELMTHLFPYVNHRAGRTLLPILDEFAQNADPAVLTNRSIDRLKALSKEPRPFCMMLFYSTTHFPFGAPYPYYGKFADKKYSGDHRYHKYTIVGRAETVTEEDKIQVNALYDGALSAVDEQVGRLAAFLDKSGLSESTVVLLFGDHGEDLYESPDTPVAHGEQLRSEFSTKTGLLILDPRNEKSARFKSVARVLDIGPTLLDRAGLPLPDREGRSLLPVIDGRETTERTAYLETGLWYDTKGSGFYQNLRRPYPDVTGILEVDPYARNEIVIQKKWEHLTNMDKHRAWIEGGFKLIRMPVVDGIRFELYDLGADPKCLHDLSSERPDKVREMNARLEDYMERVSPSELTKAALPAPVAGAAP